MGTQCSTRRNSILHHDGVEEEAQKSIAKNNVHNKQERFPSELMSLLRQPTIHQDLPFECTKFVTEIISKYADPLVSDKEALAVFSMLANVMDPTSSAKAATSLKNWGFTSEAMACLSYHPQSATESTEQNNLVMELQKICIQR